MCIAAEQRHYHSHFQLVNPQNDQCILGASSAIGEHGTCQFQVHCLARFQSSTQDIPQDQQGNAYVPATAVSYAS